MSKESLEFELEASWHSFETPFASDVPAFMAEGAFVNDWVLADVTLDEGHPFAAMIAVDVEFSHSVEAVAFHNTELDKKRIELHVCSLPVLFVVTSPHLVVILGKFVHIRNELDALMTEIKIAFVASVALCICIILTISIATLRENSSSIT